MIGIASEDSVEDSGESTSYALKGKTILTGNPKAECVNKRSDA